MKRVIFVILLVLLTGCSVNYNITIDKNLSISESVTMCEKEDFFTPYYNSTKDRIINNIYPNSMLIFKVKTIPRIKKDKALINILSAIDNRFCTWVISFVTLVTREPVENLSVWL